MDALESEIGALAVDSEAPALLDAVASSAHSAKESTLAAAAAAADAAATPAGPAAVRMARYVAKVALLLSQAALEARQNRKAFSGDEALSLALAAACDAMRSGSDAIARAAAPHAGASMDAAEFRGAAAALAAAAAAFERVAALPEDVRADAAHFGEQLAAGASAGASA